MTCSKRILLQISAIAALIFLVSCVSPVSYTGEAIAKEGQAPKDWREIEVINIDQIKRDYVIIGQCRGDELFHDVVFLKKQAARMNADAIGRPEFSGGYILSPAVRYK